MVDLVESFCRAITAHGPLLMLVVPAFGVALAFLSAAMGPVFVRNLALTNALLSGLVALSIALGAPWGPLTPKRVSDTTRGDERDETATTTTVPRTAVPVHVSSLVWARLPPLDGSPHPIELRLSTGIDGARLPFLIVLTFVMLAGLHALPGDDDATSWKAPLILLWQAALMGVVVAQDIGLWAFCLFGAGLPPMLWLGLDGGPDRREWALGRSIAWFGGSVAMLCAALGLAATSARMLEHFPRLAASTPPSFDLTIILASIEAMTATHESPRIAWSSERLVYGSCAVLAALLLLPSLPWERRSRRTLAGMSRSARIVLLGGASLAGPLVLLRLVSPPKVGLLTAIPVPLAFNALALWLAWRDRFDGTDLASGDDDSGHHPLNLLGVVACVATGAVATESAAARCGAVLMLLSCAVGCVAAEVGRGLSRTSTGWPRRFLKSLPALFLAPPFGGFVGVWLVTSAPFRLRDSLWNGPVAGSLGLAAASIAAYRIALAAFHDDDVGYVARQADASCGVESASRSDMPSFPRFAVGLIVVAVAAELAAGVWPEPIVRPMMDVLGEPATTR